LFDKGEFYYNLSQVASAADQLHPVPLAKYLKFIRQPN